MQDCYDEYEEFEDGYQIIDREDLKKEEPKKDAYPRIKPEDLEIVIRDEHFLIKW